jgi:hypothetical protein
MEIIISTSSDKEHPSEATSILFQVFMSFVRVYLTDSKTAEDELKHVLPAFIDYAKRMKEVRGEANAQKTLLEMYEDASKILPTSIKSIHRDPRYSHLKKRVELSNRKAHELAASRIKEYGKDFICHVLSTDKESVGSIIKDLLLIAHDEKLVSKSL